MHFDNLNEFFNMGGYGLYVWLSFGAGTICLIGLWIDSVLNKKALFKHVMAEQARQARIKAAAKSQGENGERV